MVGCYPNMTKLREIAKQHGECLVTCRGKVCICSCCKAEFDNTCQCIEEWNYCPQCGSEMKVEEKMKPENVLEIILPDIIELLKFMSKYGIKDESVNKHIDSFEIKNAVRFSIPEFWEDGISSNAIISDEIVKSFKEQCNKIIKNAIKFVDENADDESLDKFLSTMKYTYRVRNSEQWTCADKKEAEKRIMIPIGILQGTEYQDV